jgi:hemolysin activation/secretion protein
MLKRHLFIHRNTYIYLFWLIMVVTLSPATALSGGLPPVLPVQPVIEQRTQPAGEETALHERLAETVDIFPETVPGTLYKKGRLSAVSSVYVQEFRFTGNTAIPDKELAGVVATYTNREVTFEELQQLRQALTIYYVNKGYINSGVIIPEQDVEGGIITLKVIEGVITEIEIKGNRRLRAGYISGRLESVKRPPVNVYELQKMLQILEQDPRIKRINSQLVPGILPGESILKIHIEEADPFSLWFELSNDHSPSIGEAGLDLHVMHRNVSGYGDTLGGSFEITEGLNEFDLYYIAPVTSHDTNIMFQVKKSETTIIERPFENLDIESRSLTYGITLSRPFYRTPSRMLTLGLTGELRGSETFLLGRRYSFSSGTEEGGIDAFGATTGGSGPDGRFVSWLGQFQWIRRLGDKGGQITFKTALQLANDPLLPIEKFSVGGLYSVRGYRKNRLVRDNGLNLSIEYRIPVIHNKEKEAVLHLAAFADYGRSWNTETETPEPKDISSLGAGIIWAVTKKVDLQLYGGIPLRKIDSIDESLQDKGLHFKLTGKFF